MQFRSNTIPIKSLHFTSTLIITVTLCVVAAVSLTTIGCVDKPANSNTTIATMALTENEEALLDSGEKFFVPEGLWLKLHEQKADDTVYFSRRHHGGSAFYTKRGQLILFGSDTHGKDWTNSAYIFDTKQLEWQQLHPNDEAETYRVNPAGIPVSGKNGQRPWAMHTFGAVTYNMVTDQLIVSSYPAHMEPDRFTNALVHLWPQINEKNKIILRTIDQNGQLNRGCMITAQTVGPGSTAPPLHLDLA